MLLTVKNPFDGQDIDIEIELSVYGSINPAGIKFIEIQAMGSKELSE